MKPIVQIQLTGTLKGLLDVEPGTAFPLVFSVSDVRDIDSKKGNMSRVIKLASTPNNHKLLNHYFDVNAVAGTFNVNKVTPCIVLQNGVPIMDNSVMQLLKAEKDNTNNNHEQIIKYEVVVKDVTADFFTKLGNKELTDLSIEDLNHTYTSSNVVASFSNTVANGYKYLLPYTPGATYNLTELKPAVYAKVYFDRIFAQNGYSYEWADLSDNETRFDKYIIPYNGDVPKLRQAEIDRYRVRAEETDGQEHEPTQTAGKALNPVLNQLVIDEELEDQNNNYTPGTSTYAAPIYTIGGGGINFKLIVDWELYLDNQEAGTVYLKKVSGTVLKNDYRPLVSLNKNGSASQYSNLHTLVSNGIVSVVQDTALSTGETTLQSGLSTLNFVGNLVNTGDTFTFSKLVTLPYQQLNQAANNLRWKTTNDVAGVDAVVNVGIRINSVQLEIQPSMSGVGFGSTIFMNDYIPLKIKQSDFIKSIFTHYNIFPEIDQFNASKLILKKRDKYYDEGTEKDWTGKLDKSKQQVIEFIPSLQSKKLRLTMKQDSDDFNKAYLENVNEVYGQVEFEFENEFVRDTAIKEIIFSPTPVGATSFGAIVPYINGAAPKTNIRLLYDGGVQTCQSYTIVDYYTGTVATGTTTTNYPHLSHFDKPVNPTYDINFGVCDYYFYSSFGAKTNNNAFNLNWRRTLNQLNTGKIMTAYFNLDAQDVSQLKLSDKLFIIDSWWNINKLEYDVASDATTKVELISVDKEQKFVRFKTNRPVKPFKPDIIFSALKPLIERIFKVNNDVVTDAPILTHGKNNVIAENVKSGAVYGNNNEVTSDKVLVIGDGMTVDKEGLHVEQITIGTKTINESNAEPRGYKEYIANMTQTGTSNPVVTVLKNELDVSLSWVRTATGSYTTTSTGLFVSGKTAVFIQSPPTVSGSDVSNSYIQSEDEDTVQINTYLTNATATDGLLSNSGTPSTVVIRIYD